MMILYSMSISIGLLFLLLTHPISMGLSIIMYVLQISMIIGLMSKNFWYTYIIILVYLGGLLILFLYVTSMASNEKFYLKSSWIIKFMMIFFFFSLSLTLLSSLDFFQNQDSLPIFNQMISNMNNSYTSFYSFEISKTTLFLASYLLLCLISVVKIANLMIGPIRHMF